jgi:superfamily I DNA/RNA helicase
MDYLKGLNESQYEAVTTIQGPLMVLAGAGSGKTRVLTMRIAHLIQNGVDPFNILALTFTNKAAREMKERIARVVGDSDAKSIWMGTFHSIFARILRMEAHYLGFPSNFTIYDSQDALNVIKKVLKEMSIDSDLKERLDKAGINTLVIAGITTNHCVSTTTRMAGNYGYETYVISDATATFNRTGINGEKYDSELIHLTALANLNDEFATVWSSDKLLNEL